MSDLGKPLDDCGCCEGIAPLTPAPLDNAPGLPALAYRVGTHGSFKSTMQEELSHQPGLDRLRTRDDDDPSMALLDAWSSVLDVLTFYQERIANEGYLRTATERLSLLELAKAIGYKLGPGVAAGAYLAFTVEGALGAPGVAVIDTGTKTQSLPGPGELPQTFETTEKIEARAAWNEMRPRLREPQEIKLGLKQLYLKGVATLLQSGDGILIVGGERKDDPGNENWDFRILKAVMPIAEEDYTLVTWEEDLGDRVSAPASRLQEVFAFRQRASLFGYNAPDWRAMPASIQAAFPPDTGGPTQQWPRFSIKAINTPTSDKWVIDLDTTYPKILVNTWVVLSVPTEVELYKVEIVSTTSRADFTLTAKTTRLKLDTKEHLESFGLRETGVFAQSELLEMTEMPIDKPVSGASILLNGTVEGLTVGQLVALSGVDSGTKKPVSEVCTLLRTELTSGLTTLVLDGPLTHSYQRDTLIINANVAPATHGETKREVLGSADASLAFQKLALKQAPLTYVSATTPSGAISTLEVRVNDILWDEAESLNDLRPRDRAYKTEIADDGKVTVQFGDGVTGARPPTGQENVTATYRVGIGLAGLVKPAQISLLISRPLGVKGVANPLASSGADDPESRDDARQNAPLTVLTLGRIVSLRDFEDFARRFGGIGKAQAVWLWSGETRLVHLTVAGVTGEQVVSPLYGKLKLAIDEARDPIQRVQVDHYTLIRFRLEARVLVDRRYIKEKVHAAIREALLLAFSFEQRKFGQAVTRSEVVAAIQRVEGVEAVDLDKLYKEGKPAILNNLLAAQTARWTESNVQPPQAPVISLAELLLVNPDGIVLTEMQR